MAEDRRDGGPDEEVLDRRLLEALGAAPDEEAPGADMLARVRARLADEAAPEFPDLWGPEDVARWLRVPVDEVYAHLAELPAFEFAGRVRFRRQALEEWVQERERTYRNQAAAAALVGGRRS